MDVFNTKLLKNLQIDWKRICQICHDNLDDTKNDFGHNSGNIFALSLEADYLFDDIPIVC